MCNSEIHNTSHDIMKARIFLLKFPPSPHGSPNSVAGFDITIPRLK